MWITLLQNTGTGFNLHIPHQVKIFSIFIENWLISLSYRIRGNWDYTSNFWLEKFTFSILCLRSESVQTRKSRERVENNMKFISECLSLARLRQLWKWASFIIDNGAPYSWIIHDGNEWISNLSASIEKNKNDGLMALTYRFICS